MLLADFIKQNRLTYAEFAAQIGVPPRSLGKWCRGEATPRRPILHRITAATGGAVTANDFIVAADRRAAA